MVRFFPFAFDAYILAIWSNAEPVFPAVQQKNTHASQTYPVTTKLQGLDTRDFVNQWLRFKRIVGNSVMPLFWR